MAEDKSLPLFGGEPSGIQVEDLIGPLNEVERVNLPRRLWYAGDPKLLRMRPRIAVVGSRKASRGGLESARQLARELCEHQVVIVSGLAEGIDSAAHLAAIESGGRTIAVLGTPLDRTYPARNRALQQTIVRDHLAITQFGPGSAVRPGNFILRNRTMALVVDASIIVEASDSSGSLSQGWEALRLGRQLFLLESLCRRSDLAWPRNMVEYGAIPISKTSDILDFVPSGLGQKLARAPF